MTPEDPHASRPHADPSGRPPDLGFALPPPAKLGRGRLVVVAAGLAVLLVVAFCAAWLPRRRARHALEREVAADTGAMRVEVAKPRRIDSTSAIVLPGTIQPLEETVLYPRTSGYVTKWYFDIGDKVGEGAILADIDTPELDQQLVQARAELQRAVAAVAQTKATSAFSTQNLARYRQLVPAGVASQQELEEKEAQAEVDRANIRVAEANADAQRANIQRLLQVKTFAHVVTPFAGAVTARSVERGALVTAGNATPLFKVAINDPVRVFIQVPQGVAPSVRDGMIAKVTVREFAGRTFEGTVSRSAGALDPASRTMTTELRVPNADHALLAGMYAQASLTLPKPHAVFEIPATALFNDARGVRVATVGPDSRIHMVPVVIERDTGATIEIASGLGGEERIVKLASADLVEGREVGVR